MTTPFHIDPDISRAWTPPARIYTDPQVYELAKERIFAPSWQLVGHLDHVRVPGQVYPFTLLEGCVDAPLLLVRDRADRLHCLSNVCTHRGMMVCEHAGIESNLRCRYHGRRFSLNGKFESMPEFDGVAGFPSPADDLPEAAVTAWGPLIFASLAAERPGKGDPPVSHAVPFENWLGPVGERVGWMPLAQFKFDASRSRDYLVQCNWALYCENYLEGFHIPFVHAGLAETLDYGSYRTELFPHGSLQLGIAKGGESSFVQPPASPDFGQQIAGYYFWLFPNLMLNFYPWGLSVNIVRPLGVDRTRVSFLSYVSDESKLDAGAGAGLDRVEREDEAIVEAVQRGLRSRLYDRGRYSPTRETGTHHFHRMLAASLTDSTPSA